MTPMISEEEAASMVFDSRSTEFLKDVIRHPSLAVAELALLIEIDYLQKKKGQGLPYTFLSESAVCAAFHEAMAKHGLTIKPVGCAVHKDEPYQTTTGKTMNRTIVAVEYELTHAFTGQSRRVCSLGEGSDSGDKGVGKAMTSAYKYFFRQGNVLETGDDPDNTPSVPRANTTPSTTPSTPPTKASTATKTTSEIADAYAKANVAITGADTIERATKYIVASRKRFTGAQLTALETVFQARVAALQQAAPEDDDVSSIPF